MMFLIIGKYDLITVHLSTSFFGPFLHFSKAKSPGRVVHFAAQLPILEAKRGSLIKLNNATLNLGGSVRVRLRVALALA